MNWQRWRVAAVVALGLTCLAACSSGPAGEYTPVIAVSPPAAAVAPRGGLLGDYRWATAARSWAEAAERWEQFLQRHSPEGGEYEDNLQRLHVDTARLELARVYYVTGKTRDGDRILKQLDPSR